jgi:hypothetical protein
VVLLLAMLALFGQWLATPLHDMSDAAGIRQTSQIVAELKTVFGDAAVLCTEAEPDSGNPSPRDPAHPCDDHCPLCQLHASAMALWVPDEAPAPRRFDVAAEPVRHSYARLPVHAWRVAFARARAPPFEI